jgi:leader peptidase (prepilin peptidase) / N-methyltransferase
MIEQIFINSSIAIAGLMLGSFFNVLIWRLPRHESIILPSSHCPKCNRLIKPWENIPVFSYIFLKGKCAGCKNPISLMYPAVELLTCGLALILWHFYCAPRLDSITAWWQIILLIIECAALLVLIPVSIIDIQHYIIPDSISLGGLVVGLLASLIPGSITPLQSLMGMLCGGGTLFVIGLIGTFVLKKEDAMGGGDIKLLGFLGAVFGWKLMVMCIVFGSFLGAVVGVACLKVLPKDHRIPFGPFLSLGMWAALFFGDTLLNWYLSFL